MEIKDIVATFLVLDQSAIGGLLRGLHLSPSGKFGGGGGSGGGGGGVPGFTEWRQDCPEQPHEGRQLPGF